MPNLLIAARKLNWVFALVLAFLAAFVYRAGYEQIGGVMWLLSLLPVLPIWEPAQKSATGQGAQRGTDLGGVA